jgi:hypothetical protein
LVETEKQATKRVNVKGDVITTPIYTELQSKAVCEFKLRRYGMDYRVKIYSKLGQGNLAQRKAQELKEGMETVLYNAIYKEEKFIPKTGKYAGVECTSFQIIVNG